MSTVFQIKKFPEIKHLLPQNSWWIQRLEYDKDKCENEIIAYAEGDILLDNLNLDFIYLNIKLNDESVRDHVSMVLVQGNVTAKNISNAETDGAVTLMVLGNLETDNISVGGQEIYVTGNLTVHDLFWGDYNHGELIVEGSVTAKVFMASDEYHFDWKRFYNKENVNIDLLLNDDEVNGEYPRELMETAFQEECLLKEEDIDDEIYSFKYWLDGIEIARRLNENISILLDTIKPFSEDDIPFVFENDYLTDNNMERFRTSFLFSLFGGDETILKEMLFQYDDINMRVRAQQNKPFSESVHLQYKEEYSVMIFYFTYEGNLRRGVVHKSLVDDDKEWHSLDMEQPPQHLKELTETGWKNLLEIFSAAEYYQQKFSEEVTVQEISNILALPMVKDNYSDYYKENGKSFYVGNLSYQFRQKENEKDLCPRISALKAVPYATEEENKILFYHFDILQNESGNDEVKLRTQDKDGYGSKVYIVSITDIKKIKEALKCFAILKKKIVEKNEEYVNESIDKDETDFNIDDDIINTKELKSIAQQTTNTESFITLPVQERYQYLETLWKDWIDSIAQIVPKDNEYFNLTDGISQNDIDLYTKLGDDITIPDELINFCKIQNVTYNPVTSVFSISVNGWNYDLLRFQDILNEWNDVTDLQEEEFDDEILEDISEKIKLNNYTNPHWIPFATGRNGDYLLYDTDPSDKGKYGQIIELQNESWQRNVVADSLEELIQLEINNIKNGNIKKFDFILGKNK